MWTSFLLLLFISLQATATAAQETLVATKNASEESCKRYVKALRAEAELDDTGEKFKRRKAVDSVLKIFRPEKGESPEFRRMIRGVIAKLPNITDSDLLSIFYEAPNSCSSVVAEYNALKGLLGSVKVYKLGPKKEAEARDLTLDYLKLKVTEPGTLIEQMVQIALFKKLSDDQFLKLHKEQAQKISNLKEEAEGVKKQLTSEKHAEGSWPSSREAFIKLNDEEKKRFIEEFKLELQKTEELRNHLLRLYREFGLV